MSVNIFPRNDFNVEVCSHRWNKSMTFCDNCDTLSNNKYMPLMFQFMKNNIQCGVFSTIHNNSHMTMASNLERFGVVNNSAYCTFGSTD